MENLTNPKVFNNTRIKQKHDIEANWTLAGNPGEGKTPFAPLPGEIIIYDPDENNPRPRFKIGQADPSGEGNVNINDLPFVPVDLGAEKIYHSGSEDVLYEETIPNLEWPSSGYWIIKQAIPLLLPGQSYEVTITDDDGIIGHETKTAVYDGPYDNKNYLRYDISLTNGETLELTLIKELEELTENVLRGHIYWANSEGKTITISIKGPYYEIVPIGADFLLNSNIKNGIGCGSISSLAGDANGEYSAAFGLSAADGNFSFASGANTYAVGPASHAEGNDSYAFGRYSHAEGEGTIAGSIASHVQGRANLPDYSQKYVHIVGNAPNNLGTKSNAHALDWDGNAYYAGDVYANTTFTVDEATINEGTDYETNIDTFTSIGRKLGYEPVEEELIAGTLTPEDNHIYKGTLSGALTINVGENACPLYSSYFMIKVGAGASLAFTMADSVRLADPDEILSNTNLEVGTYIEISIFNGSIILKKVELANSAATV